MSQIVTIQVLFNHINVFYIYHLAHQANQVGVILTTEPGYQLFKKKTLWK